MTHVPLVNGYRAGVALTGHSVIQRWFVRLTKTRSCRSVYVHGFIFLLIFHFLEQNILGGDAQQDEMCQKRISELPTFRDALNILVWTSLLVCGEKSRKEHPMARTPGPVSGPVCQKIHFTTLASDLET